MEGSPILQRGKTYLYRPSYQVEHFCIETFIMERLRIGYSIKNVPKQTKTECKTQLMSKAESVLKRMCWKGTQFLEKLDSSNKETA